MVEWTRGADSGSGLGEADSGSGLGERTRGSGLGERTRGSGRAIRRGGLHGLIPWVRSPASADRGGSEANDRAHLVSVDVRVGCGPLAVEAGLLDELAGWIEAAKQTPEMLSRPVRIVVPSGSLRSHLSVAITRRFGAAAGVRVQTLHRLALDVLEAAGAPAPRGEWLTAVVVRRLASRSPELSERLEGLHDGYGIVAAGVSDLLDAGFERAHFEGVEEALGDLSAGAVGARARAVLGIAAASIDAFGDAGLDHRASLFRSARELIETRGAAILPTRVLFVHGYADATGTQADLIESLVRSYDARIWLDRPSDPAEPEHEDPSNAFAERMTRRMLDAAGMTPPPPDAPLLPRVEVVYAPGIQAEVRAVANQLRQLLDAGAAPEGIGVVARQLGPYRLALRQHLDRLGVPFSGSGAMGPPDPTRRRIEALLDLLRRRGRTPTERWLDLVEALPGAGALTPGGRADLLLGLHGFGAGRLEDVARLDAESIGRDRFLPQRIGFEPSGEEAGRTRRRVLAGRWLRAARDAADATRRRLSEWPENAPLAQHCAALRSLLRDDLGWTPDSPGAIAVEKVLLDDEASAPGAFVLAAEEFPAVVEPGLERAAGRPIGGRGAGVQLLEVMEARARTFDHLFVIGMNRGVFPRTITEDPLIPDSLRWSLRVTLPDLPVKADGHDEDRYLFAQLMAAAPAVTLSCALCDDDGKARPVSPLLEGLRWASHVGDPRMAPALYSAASLDGEVAPLRPAHEHALLAGLHGGSRDHFGNVLAVALGESARAVAVSDGSVEELAAGRVSVLSEQDPRGSRRSTLGPYFGLVGAPTCGFDPRATDLYVTTIETLAKCPWQGFLRRVLRLEPAPDPHAALPSASDPRLVGSLVHRVLEEIVRVGLGEPSRKLADAVGLTPIEVSWPEPGDLDRLVEDCAVALAREEGIGFQGFPRVMALQARPRIELARLHAWPGDGFEAVAVEAIGRARVRDHHDVEREILFKADRIDRAADALRLVDYKTGKPPSVLKREESRVHELHRQVRRGERLQSVAYALAGAELGFPQSEGVYLHLVPDDVPAREFVTRADDQDFIDDFSQAVGTVLEAWDEGCFVPRLAKPGSDEEPKLCERCEVKEACVRGDSGARMRLVEWTAQAPPQPDAAIERALLGIWNLPAEGE
jgi:hypothetical protein